MVQIFLLQSQPLHSIIHEILTCHYNGISFTERNAGESLDRDMSQRGFDVHTGVNDEYGFIRGGSESNCGTWMDKMGSSTIANNKGVPATPRYKHETMRKNIRYFIFRVTLDIHLIYFGYPFGIQLSPANLFEISSRPLRISDILHFVDLESFKHLGYPN